MIATIAPFPLEVGRAASDSIRLRFGWSGRRGSFAALGHRGQGERGQHRGHEGGEGGHAAMVA